MAETSEGSRGVVMVPRFQLFLTAPQMVIWNKCCSATAPGMTILADPEYRKFHGELLAAGVLTQEGIALFPRFDWSEYLVTEITARKELSVPSWYLRHARMFQRNVMRLERSFFTSYDSLFAAMKKLLEAACEEPLSMPQLMSIWAWMRGELDESVKLVTHVPGRSECLVVLAGFERSTLVPGDDAPAFKPMAESGGPIERAEKSERNAEIKATLESMKALAKIDGLTRTELSEIRDAAQDLVDVMSAAIRRKLTDEKEISRQKEALQLRESEILKELESKDAELTKAQLAIADRMTEVAKLKEAVDLLRRTRMGL